ncbi:DUF2147 domain-containing protein [Roseibium album]|uniref:DUF2147 domain-containing protein n=1 Tax=Roseibium album TaxID=311410 RepID=UPI002491C392|nr:DUF2147 domain-containing protein [Roseibium album]
MPDMAIKPDRLLAVLSLASFISLLPGLVEAGTPPEGYWLNGDKSVVVAIGTCEAGSAKLCGIIVGLPGATSNTDLERYRSELCGLPLIWDLQSGDGNQFWQDGKILDPETGQVHDLQANFVGHALELRVFEAQRTKTHKLTWQKVETFKEPRT